MERGPTANRGWVRGGLLAMGALACLAGPAVGAREASAPAPETAPAPDRPTALVSQVGRQMFFDPNLSASGKQACATCHDPHYAYGPPPGKAIALGGKDMQQPGTRAVPSLRYLHGAPQFREQFKFLDGDVGPVGGFTWDGRADSLAAQARIPLFASNEMANADEAEVVRKLRSAGYAGLFRQAFGERIFEDRSRRR